MFEFMSVLTINVFRIYMSAFLINLVNTAFKLNSHNGNIHKDNH